MVQGQDNRGQTGSVADRPRPNRDYYARFAGPLPRCLCRALSGKGLEGLSYRLRGLCLSSSRR
jgi:hypothetical protein